MSNVAPIRPPTDLAAQLRDLRADIELTIATAVLALEGSDDFDDVARVLRQHADNGLCEAVHRLERLLAGAG